MSVTMIRYISLYEYVVITRTNCNFKLANISVTDLENICRKLLKSQQKWQINPSILIVNS